MKSLYDFVHFGWDQKRYYLFLDDTTNGMEETRRLQLAKRGFIIFSGPYHSFLKDRNR